MIVRVVYLDGHEFIGRRGLREAGFPLPHESYGTHHLTVLDGDALFAPLKGQEISVPLANVRFIGLDQAWHRIGEEVRR